MEVRLLTVVWSAAVPIAISILALTISIATYAQRRFVDRLNAQATVRVLVPEHELRYRRVDQDVHSARLMAQSDTVLYRVNGRAWQELQAGHPVTLDLDPLNTTQLEVAGTTAAIVAQYVLSKSGNAFQAKPIQVRYRRLVEDTSLRSLLAP